MGAFVFQIKTIFLHWLPCILRMSRPGGEPDTSRKSLQMRELELKERSSKSLLANVLDIDDDFRHHSGTLQTSSAVSAAGFLRGAHTHHEDGGGGGTLLHGGGGGSSCLGPHRELTLILKELRVITDKLRKEDEAAEVTNDWKFAAMVVDRLCLIIFTLFTNEFYRCTMGHLFLNKNQDTREMCVCVSVCVPRMSCVACALCDGDCDRGGGGAGSVVRPHVGGGIRSHLSESMDLLRAEKGWVRHHHHRQQSRQQSKSQQQQQRARSSQQSGGSPLESGTILKKDKLTTRRGRHEVLHRKSKYHRIVRVQVLKKGVMVMKMKLQQQYIHIAYNETGNGVSEILGYCDYKEGPDETTTVLVSGLLSWNSLKPEQSFPDSRQRRYNVVNRGMTHNMSQDISPISSEIRFCWPSESTYVLIKRKRPLNFAGGYWFILKQVDRSVDSAQETY
ncbi:hypothetical protein C0J52_22943 [Blattella germanica]|nr:hypothetical protein C0J52_22943 [Blattella germanica]